MRSINLVSIIVAVSLVAGCGREPQSSADPEAQARADSANPFPNAEAPGANDDTEQEIANKQVVLQYYDAANNAKDFDAASRFVSPDLNLHDPAIADGLGGLQARIQSLTAEHPQSRVDVKRVLTSGDHVFLHSHTRRTPDSVGFITGDIFRLENGKIVEQWTVLHPIPEKPHPDNPNGPF